MSELVAGKPQPLSDTVTRVLAPNPSVFTGPGTNTYLLARRAAAAGSAKKEIVVLDPGPADDAHITALLLAAESLGGRIAHVVCTHTHEDHSPGAALLAARTGARLYGMPAPNDGYNDLSFAPDHTPADGEVLELAGIRLRAIATPGHVSNHQCFLLENENLLFTGDHLIQGSTVVIVPPEGSMREYLASLAGLQTLKLAAIAPGHGTVMMDPAGSIAATLQHRRAREAKALAALRELGSATLDELLPRVYDDVPVFMHMIARLSLHAHVIKLVEDGIAAETATGRWQV